jgi:hypothetical protein
MMRDVAGAVHASDADRQDDLRQDDNRRPCPRCSTTLMLTRVGAYPDSTDLEVVLATHGWCPSCDWEGWLGSN